MKDSITLSFLICRDTYHIKLRLGDPPKEFYLDVDTGSDITWVNCEWPSTSPSVVSVFSQSLHSNKPFKISDCGGYTSLHIHTYIP